MECITASWAAGLNQQDAGLCLLGPMVVPQAWLSQRNAENPPDAATSRHWGLGRVLLGGRMAVGAGKAAGNSPSLAA